MNDVTQILLDMCGEIGTSPIARGPVVAMIEYTKINLADPEYVEIIMAVLEYPQILLTYPECMGNNLVDPEYMETVLADPEYLTEEGGRTTSTG